MELHSRLSRSSTLPATSAQRALRNKALPLHTWSERFDLLGLPQEERRTSGQSAVHTCSENASGRGGPPCVPHSFTPQAERFPTASSYARPSARLPVCCTWPATPPRAPSTGCCRTSLTLCQNWKQRSRQPLYS